MMNPKVKAVAAILFPLVGRFGLDAVIDGLLEKFGVGVSRFSMALKAIYDHQIAQKEIPADMDFMTFVGGYIPGLFERAADKVGIAPPAGSALKALNELVILLLAPTTRAYHGMPLQRAAKLLDGRADNDLRNVVQQLAPMGDWLALYGVSLWQELDADSVQAGFNLIDKEK